jgi:hypothetical protein
MRAPHISQWFRVRFDEEDVYIEANPPGRAPWAQRFAWAFVERILFRAEGFEVSDGIYVFIRGRAESFVIPIEASGSELWSEIIRRGLFDGELAIAASTSTGGDYWWPPQQPTAAQR